MFALLTFPTPLPSLCDTSRITRSRSTWLRAVKCVLCHVLENRMPLVMDGRVASRGVCFTLGNPKLQPSCLAMDVAASPVHAS
jgi:hypothetical protein